MTVPKLADAVLAASTVVAWAAATAFVAFAIVGWSAAALSCVLVLWLAGLPAFVRRRFAFPRRDQHP
jgi:hypothetical protein